MKPSAASPLLRVFRRKISEINHDSNVLKLLAFIIANCRRFENMTINHKIDDAPSLSTDKLEREIGKIIPRRNTPFTPEVHIAPMPDYVEHREGVSQCVESACFRRDKPQPQRPRRVSA
jgi:hypothetical protein